MAIYYGEQLKKLCQGSVKRHRFQAHYCHHCLIIISALSIIIIHCMLHLWNYRYYLQLLCCFQRNNFPIQNFLQEIRSRAKKAGPCSRMAQASAHLSPTLHTASSRACLTLSDLFHHKPPPRKKRLPKITSEEGEDGRDSKTEQPQPSTSLSGKRSRVGPNLYVALAAAQFKLHNGHGRGEDVSRELQNSAQQQRRNCAAKLKMVHAILCCLYNMRNRDLRSRVSGLTQVSVTVTLIVGMVNPLPTIKTARDHVLKYNA